MYSKTHLRVENLLYGEKTDIKLLNQSDFCQETDIKESLSILEIQLQKSISRLPDIEQKYLCIQNEAMNISLQKNMVLTFLDDYYQKNEAKAPSHFVLDTLYECWHG